MVEHLVRRRHDTLARRVDPSASNADRECGIHRANDMIGPRRGRAPFRLRTNHVFRTLECPAITLLLSYSTGRGSWACSGNSLASKG